MPVIFVVPDDLTAEAPLYRAEFDNKHSVALTVGQAVDGLIEHIGPPQETTVVVIQPFKPDRFFGAEQIRRLKELMAKRREARDHGGPWTEAEDQELHALINEELDATIARSRMILAASRS